MTRIVDNLSNSRTGFVMLDLAVVASVIPNSIRHFCAKYPDVPSYQES